MGELISFQREARRRLTTAPPDGEAQILFFTGVRYCRVDDDDQESRKTRRTTPRSRRKKA
jgi:hypothetical protein